MKRSVTYHFLLFGPLFPLLLFSFSFAQPSLNTTEQYLECNATRMLTCGDIHTDINFPFWTKDQPSYCGHPGYQLTCDHENKTLSMNISDKSYHVREIDYENQFLNLIDADLSAAVSCPEKITNTTISESYYLTYVTNDINLTLYLNCSFSNISLPNNNVLIPIPCTSSFPDFFGQNAFFTLTSGPIKFEDNEQYCNSTVLVPVYDYNSQYDFSSGTKKFSDVLKAGFGVKWTIGQGWCDDCTNSGGLCGYNISAPDNRTCFCPPGAMSNGINCSHGMRPASVFFVSFLDLYSGKTWPRLIFANQMIISY